MNILDHIDSIHEALKTQWEDAHIFRWCDSALRCQHCYEDILQRHAACIRQRQRIHDCIGQLRALSRHCPSLCRDNMQRLITACLTYDWETACVLSDALRYSSAASCHRAERDRLYLCYLDLEIHLKVAQTAKTRLKAALHKLPVIVLAYRASIHGSVAHWKALSALFDGLLRRVTEGLTRPAAVHELQDDDARVYQHILSSLPILSEMAEDKQEPRPLKRPSTDTLASCRPSKQGRFVRNDSVGSTQRDEHRPSPQRSTPP